MSRILTRSSFFVLALICGWTSAIAAQEGGQITGSVVDAETLQPLATVQVYIQGTSIGALTSGGGQFTISQVPPGTHTLVAQRIGYQLSETEVTVTSGESTTVQLSISPAVLSLQGIVATGLIDPVEGARSPITVGRIDREQMPVSAAGPAIQGLAGLMPGVAINRVSGAPGEDVSVMLRTPTSATQGSEPMYVVDGVILGAGTVDIEALDIESIEVVKGAAAASLYGSRAAAGVISITTKRGQGLPIGETQFSARTEFGRSLVQTGGFRPPTHHAYLLDPTGTTYVDRDGNPVDKAGRVMPPASQAFMSNPYPGPIYDNFYNVFQGGTFNTQSFSVMQNGETTNFAVTLNRFRQGGTLGNHEGYTRNAFRVNLDHRFMNTMSLSVSGYHSRDDRDMLNVSPAFGRRAPPDVDLRLKDENGEYVKIPDPQVNFENPLWTQSSRENRRTGSRSLGSANLNWSPSSWLSFSANASYDRGDSMRRAYVAKGTPRSLNTTQLADGEIEYDTDVRETMNADAQFSLRRDFGPLNARTTVRGVLERNKEVGAFAEGAGFFVGGVPRIDLTANRNAESSQEEIKSLGYLWDTAFDYAGKYILTVLGRRDGSSLFGPQNRWHNYYRIAGAWRIAEEPWFNIPNVDEFKLRFAQGTAGGRPGFDYQYETWQVTQSGVSKGTLGNKNLRPEHTLEREATLELILANRVGVELTYAWSRTTDQLVPIFLPNFAGYSTQWANQGTVIGTTWEAQIEARMISRPGLNWTSMFVFDRPRAKITEWPGVCQNVAWRWRCAGHSLFEIWGGQWIRHPEQLLEFHQGGELAPYIDQFQRNDDGFLVWVGEGNTYMDGIEKGLWGTSTTFGGVPYQWGIPFERLLPGGVGSRDQIGNSNYMNFGWANTVQLGGLSLHAHLHASVGGEIVTEQYGLERFNTHTAMDQAGKPDELKKPIQYYHALASNRGNSFNVQPADFLKLRTVSLNYRLTDEWLRRLNLSQFGLETMTVGVIGQNMFMLKRCDCTDPEQGLNLNTRSASVGNGAYPLSRTITMEVGVTF